MKNHHLYKIIFMFLFSHIVLAEPSVTTQEKQLAATPQQVLIRLKEGNERFINARMKNRDLLAKAHITSAGQYPVAVVLSCMDSRTPPELLFDQGLGDIFAIRIAGNIVNDDILGSMEFGTQLIGSKLIAVIGHTSCGAMRGACEGAKLDHLTDLLNKIKPAVTETKKQDDKGECSNAKFVDEIAKNNVLLVMQQIKNQSPVIAKLIAEGKVGIVGGIQDLATGKVTFFEEASIMPKQ